ncbi:acetyl-CoA synthetase-like protein, partial [Ramicandelaber brevisporus]
SWTYADLRGNASAIAKLLLSRKPAAKSLNEDRVAILCPGGCYYAAAMWGVWAAGGIAVPLAVSYPPKELAFYLEDTNATAILAHPSLVDTATAAAAQAQSLTSAKIDVFSIADTLQDPTIRQSDIDVGSVPINDSNRAMLIYTSGTSTGKPKGVVTRFSNLTAQTDALISAWNWSTNDKLLHCLPLHHVHGVTVALACALRSGASLEMMPRFDAATIWKRVLHGAPDLTLFMGVPTMYVRLLQYYDEHLDSKEQRMAKDAWGRLRMTVSGSSALPTSVAKRWKDVTGHTMLERYGMTEIGMGLSNSASNEAERFEGCVGLPLPGVSVRLCYTEDDPNGSVYRKGDVVKSTDVPGEIQIKGASVFDEYWNRPAEMTTKEFTADGWFRTGDIAIRDSQFARAPFRILGRNSIDIIKSGGYKISALEIERHLLEHPRIADCAVVGIQDVEWGERVAAVVAPKSKGSRPSTPVEGGDELRLDAESIRAWLKKTMAHYKVPSRYIVLEEGEGIPRNVMHKIDKKVVRAMF